ncbi:MAG: hypothetical protein ACT4P7_22095 [Gemmatimonadaceae bacterium]
MAMLTAWSIINKVNDRAGGHFSDVVLVVTPNVTIRDRLRELSPDAGDASITARGNVTLRAQRSTPSSPPESSTSSRSWEAMRRERRRR